MSQIEAEIIIPAPLEAVYAVAKDIERFPEFFPDVESVTITERTEKGYISEWVGIIEKFDRKIKWSEEDVWDDDAHTCTFHAVGGNWKKYDGLWTFATVEGGTRMWMQLDCELNVPLLGALINNLVGKLAKENVEKMFEGIQKRVLGEA